MRMFLFNPDQSYTRADIRKRIHAGDRTLNRELSLLLRAGLVKRKVSASPRSVHKIVLWSLNNRFSYLTQLQNLLVGTIFLDNMEVVRRFSKAGHLKLLIVAGVFIRDPDSRADILIVGDRLRKNLIESVIRRMEGEIGKELRYAFLETPDFQYRLSISDKLIRDILEYPHQKLLDRLGLRP